MKTKVEDITLNGINQYMGGKIYYCNFSPSFSEKPSEVQFNVVNEKGSYQTPNIKLNQAVQVKIGKLDLGDMFAYKYKNRYSSQGNFLEVTFIDPSFVLDKIFVGLNGKHGWTSGMAKQRSEMNEKTFAENQKPIAKTKKEEESSSSSSSSQVIPAADGAIYEKITDNFLIIGRQFHPCDEDKDNVVTYDEAFNVDPCDPCKSCPEDKYEDRCKELAYTTIFESAYSFKDLVEAFALMAPKVGSVNITLQVPEGISADSKKYEEFYRDYFGTLREVLTAWANDFGLNWYYDMLEKQIKFIDISTQEIKVQVDKVIDKYKDKTLISYDHEVSAENTNQRGAISWYERCGEKKSFDCSKATTVVLSALYGADYLGNRSRKLKNGEKINSNTDCMGSILKAYNPMLRDTFWLRTIYGFTKSSEMIPFLSDFSIKPASSSSSSASEEEGVIANDLIIPEYGDMRILAVIDCNLSKADKEKTKFQKIANLNYNDLLLQLNEYDAIKFLQMSGFFVVAYIDEQSLEKRYEMEDELYDFLGRFYTRESLFRLCGMTGNEEFVKNNTNIESADGSAQIYSKKDGIGSHPLSKYKYYKSGYLGCVVGSGNLTPDENNEPAPLAKEKGGAINKTQGFQLVNTTNPDGSTSVGLQDTPPAYKTAEGSNTTLFSANRTHEDVPRFEQTAIILDREPKWIPEVQTFQDTYNEYISNGIGDLQWKLYGGNGVPPNGSFLSQAYGGDTGFFGSGNAGKLKIFIVYTGEFKVFPAFQKDFKDTVKNPLDQVASVTKKMLRRVGGKNSALTPIGLLNNDCHKISFSGGSMDKLPVIYTPPHTFVKDTKDTAISKDFMKQAAGQSKGGTTVPCDKALQTEQFRVPAYRVYVSQSFSQSVVLPKIQTGVFAGMEPDEGVMKFDIVYTKVTDDDFKSYTGSNGYGCIPNTNYLTGINNAYTGNVFANKDPDDTLNLEIKGLPDISSYNTEIKDGLESVSIQISDQGISTNLRYSTKMIKGISSDLLKFQNSRRFSAFTKGV